MGDHRRRGSKRGMVVVLLAAVALVPLHQATADENSAFYALDTFPPVATDNAVLKWNEAALACIRATKPGPTVVARSLFIVHAATYDAWSAYDAKAVPTIRTGFARRPSSHRTVANKSAAISYAAHRALSDLARNAPFQSCRTGFDQRLTSMGYSLAEATSAAPASTAGMDGKRAADNIVTARRADGANQAGDYADTTGYQPVNTPDRLVDPWRWQPIRVPLGNPDGVAQKPLTPHWGKVRGFDPKLSEQVFQVTSPHELDADERAAMVDEIVAGSAGLTDRAKAIAEYWADGPQSELPPGHWNLFAQWMSRRWKQSVDADAKMFLALNGAMLDASIAAWGHKYRWDFARPVSAVRALKAGQLIRAWAGPGRGTETIRGEDWLPYQPVTFPTPPFPAYSSGHSTFSGAGAAVLKDFGAIMGRDGSVFGASLTIKAGSSLVEPGLTPRQDVVLRWAKVTDAADEAGLSRRYGGIHWSVDDTPARDMGKKCGEAAFSWAKKYWEGG